MLSYLGSLASLGGLGARPRVGKVEPVWAITQAPRSPAAHESRHAEQRRGASSKTREFRDAKHCSRAKAVQRWSCQMLRADVARRAGQMFLEGVMNTATTTCCADGPSSCSDSVRRCWPAPNTDVVGDEPAGTSVSHPRNAAGWAMRASQSDYQINICENMSAQPAAE